MTFLCAEIRSRNCFYRSHAFIIYKAIRITKCETTLTRIVMEICIWYVDNVRALKTFSENLLFKNVFATILQLFYYTHVVQHVFHKSSNPKRNLNKIFSRLFSFFYHHVYVVNFSATFYILCHTILVADKRITKRVPNRERDKK